VRRDLNFIHNQAAINLMVAERVEDILPKLTEAARKVSEAEREMTMAPAERM
jgi:hypothetical protein